MPKPLKNKAKRKPKDENESAFAAVQRLLEMGEAKEPPPAELSAYMARIGRKGGQIGGKRRLITMTQERREEIALKAARARWGKKAKRA